MQTPISTLQSKNTQKNAANETCMCCNFCLHICQHINCIRCIRDNSNISQWYWPADLSAWLVCLFLLREKAETFLFDYYSFRGYVSSYSPICCEIFLSILQKKRCHWSGQFFTSSMFSTKTMFEVYKHIAVRKWVDTKTASMFFHLKIRFCVLINNIITIT